MDKETIIKMARESGLHIATDVNWMPIIGLEYAEKFAKLVAQHEREACADLLMGLHHTQMGNHNYYHYAANAIEELRGNT